MEQKVKNEIETISKEFSKGIIDDAPISWSGFYVVDPLSAYLNFCGFKNKLSQTPPTENRPLVLIMTFEDGTQFIPSGSDIEVEGTTDWLWID